MQNIQLLQFELRFGFFSGLPSAGDLFAKRAGMFAVKSIFDGYREGFRPRVIREHPGPRDGLQHGPMAAGRAEQRNNEQQMTGAREHGALIRRGGKNVKRYQRLAAPCELRQKFCWRYTFRTEFLPPKGLGTVSLARGSGIQRPSTTRQYS